MKTLTRLLAVSLVLVIFTACSDEPVSPESTLTPGPTRAFSTVDDQGIPISFDAYLVNIARHGIPGFGGMYRAANGDLVVRLTNPGLARTAEAFLAAEWVRQGRKLPNIKVEGAEYNFVQLHEWKQRIWRELDHPNLVTIDADERVNRVVLGVDDLAAEGSIRAQVIELGMPPDLLEIRRKSKPVRRVGVRDKVRPVRSGFRIELGAEYGSIPCTIGVNARFNGQRIFVTASHCAPGIVPYVPRIGSLEFFQANESDGRIGVQVMDRAEWNCEGTGRPCRWSDAQYVKYDSGVQDIYGYLTKLDGAPAEGGPSTLTVDPDYPQWPIKNVQGRDLHDPNNFFDPGFWLVGDWMIKVGQRSGMTRGQITESCVIVPTDTELKCQLVTTVYSDGGDSGAALFGDYWSETETWGGIPSSELFQGGMIYGILWGGPSNDPNTTYFSPMSGVMRDLGRITICASGYNC